MAAESPRRTSRPAGVIARPLPVSDKTTFGTVVDFISDIVQQPGSGSFEEKDKITWVKFANADITENTCGEHKTSRLDGTSSPLLLIIGYANGVQIWTIPASGEAQEVLSLRQGAVKAFTILPTPVPVGSGQDMFLNKRPIAAMSEDCGQSYSTLHFISLKIGDIVHTIKFKSRICNIYCNKKVIVVTFQERIAVFDACTFKERFTILSCNPNGGQNPVALGSQWLAFSDSKIVSVHQSCGGVAGCGENSYAATVINAAMNISKSLASMFGDTVAGTLTGSNKQNHIIGKKDSQLSEAGTQTQSGIVTIVDVTTVGEGELCLTEESGDGIIAHFVAHVNGPLAALQFDPTGTLLATADGSGQRFHVFKIFPHTSCSSLGAVHHLYTLNRGQTSATVQSITFSLDSRWIAVSTHRGTTHTYPITPYGGPITARTHTSPRVVNRLSRFHKSAGLEDLQQTTTTGRNSPSFSNSPSSSGFCGIRTYDSHPSVIYHSTNSNRMNNPRLPPYPHPVVVAPLVKIRSPSPYGGFSYGGGQKSPPTRGAKVHSDNSIVASAFAPQRSWLVGSPGITIDKGEKRPMDSLFVVGCSGTVFEYCLEPKPTNQTKPAAKPNDDSSLELECQLRAQWQLSRLVNGVDVKPPLSSTNPLIIAQEVLRSHNDPSIARPRPPSPASPTLSDIPVDDRWLSQVEIVTYAGPHRRLWLGPQFSFQTYQHPANTTILSATSSALLGQCHESAFHSFGKSSSHEDHELESLGSISSARSNPMAMPGGARYKTPIVEAGSFDQSQGLLEVYGYSWPDSLPSAGGIVPHHFYPGLGGLSHPGYPDERPSEEQLRESLAEAMLESPQRGSQHDGNSPHSSPRNMPGDSMEVSSQPIMSGRPLVGAYLGGSGMGGNSEDLQNWETTGSSEELSTSSSHSGSASQMSDAPLHPGEHLISFPGTTTPPSSPDVLETRS